MTARPTRTTPAPAGVAAVPGRRARRGRWWRSPLKVSAAVAAAAAGLLVLEAVAEADRGADAARPLFTEELGTAGPVVAFLPGVGATSRYWRAPVAPLARSHRLVLVDPLGFGRSPKPWTTYTVDRHVAELHRVLGRRGRLTLVGHSLGARVAVAYAARHPEQVERLVLVSLPYFGGRGKAQQYLRERGGGGWVWTHLVPAAISCVASRRLLGWLLPHVLRDMPPEVVDELALMTWRSSTSTLWEVLYRYDLARDLARLPAGLPVRLLHGERDESAPLARVRELADGHPTWRLRVLPRGGHHPVLHATAWTLGELRDAIPASP